MEPKYPADDPAENYRNRVTIDAALLSEKERLYVIYGQNNREYPGKFICRLWIIDGVTLIPADPPVTVATTLEECRVKIPPAFEHVARRQQDDVSMIEFWV